MTWLEIALVCVVAAGVAYVIGAWLFKVDSKIEDRKRNLMKLAGVLRGVGLTKVPELLEDIVVGDWSKVVHNAKEVVKLLEGGEDAVLAEFSTVFEKVLVAKLKTETGRAYVAAKLTDCAKAGDVSIVADAPKAGVV